MEHRTEPATATVNLEALPPSHTTRWVARRKAQVVEAVQSGLLNLDDALARYRLSVEEFRSWQRALRREGLRGLQITHAHVRTLADGRPVQHDARRNLHLV
ncbi:MAG: DUF1153 domain-containing protein [Novosphingobium sp.]|nr:DUF1153 domain-containing protein [Novosphingobium sp.]